MTPPTPLDIARAMFSRDRASQSLGMELVDVTAGFARLTMRVRPDMVNGLGACHGGIIFTLADSSFAFACNSHNFNTVAAGCSIEFLNPGKQGDLLTAIAQERIVRGRSGVYDVTVTNQHDETLALFRGKSARIPGEVIATER